MDETLVFFGSGPVAAAALNLLAQVFKIEAIITKPRPAHHKGAFPVLDIAAGLELPVLTPANRTELTGLFAEKPVRSRLGVVIDYGIIIAREVIDFFPLGIVNSHFSLLPQWRGADPITFAVLSGQERTGVSLMLTTEALDEGPLLAQSPCPLRPGITAPELTEELIGLSHEALKTVLPLYVAGEIQPADQLAATMADDKKPSYSRKLTKHDGVLDFTKPADQLEREIRAFAGWPRSRTRIGDTEAIITKAHVSGGQGPAGSVWQKGKQFGFHTPNGILIIDKLIPAGKQAMSAEAFLAGYSLS